MATARSHLASGHERREVSAHGDPRRAHGAARPDVAGASRWDVARWAAQGVARPTTQNARSMAHDSPAHAPSPARLLDLQRSVGNRATADLAQAARGSRDQVRPLAIQRYDTGEHAQMGSAQPITINGVTFERRQLTAMGDFYASYADMMNADPAELRRLKAGIEQQTKLYQHQPGGKDVPEGKDGWDGMTGGRYLELAKANDTHFAPGGRSGGKDHRTAWQENHVRALAKVRAAVENHPNASVAVSPEAYAQNAFGNHFLTDAFSAGHLIAKADVMAEAKQSFDALEHTEAWYQVYFYRNDFTDRVASIVMSDPRAKVLDQYRLKLIAYRDVDAHRLSELLFQFAGRERELFYSNVVKSIHDELNRAIKQQQPGGPASIEVENNRGDVWSLSGDTTLERSPRTLEIINKAIEHSEQNLRDAAAEPPSAAGPLGFSDFIAKVPAMAQSIWDYTPHPTAAAQQQVDRIRTESTDTGSVVAAQKFAKVILDHMDEVVAGLVDKGVLRTKADLRKDAQAIMAGPML